MPPQLWRVASVTEGPLQMGDYVYGKVDAGSIL